MLCKNVRLARGYQITRYRLFNPLTPRGERVLNVREEKLLSRCKRSCFARADSQEHIRNSKVEWSATLLASPHFNKTLLSRFRPRDVLKPALYLLQAEINKRIANSSSPDHLAIVPRLVWCPGPMIDGVAKPDHHQRIIFEPTNLLAAMWFQFAQAVTEEYQLQECKECGEYFQIGKGARRIHTETCSTRCRKRASRKRPRKSLR